MDLNALTGSALDYSAFDLNKDGRFDSGDWVTYSGGRGVASGIKFDHEIPMPTILADDENSETKVLTRDVRIQENPGPGREGRQSWREIMDVN
jgi:type IV pilus assembly protein PilY1